LALLASDTLLLIYQITLSIRLKGRFNMSKTRLFTTVSIYSFHMLKSSTAQIEKIIELAKQKEEDVHPLSGKARALLELAAAIPDTRNALIATWVA
jgi:hypothetical protein